MQCVFLTQVNNHGDEDNESEEIVEGRGEEYDGDDDVGLCKVQSSDGLRFSSTIPTIR